MSYNELDKMPVPKYNNAQRHLNSITHLIGAAIAVAIYLGLLHVMATKGGFKFIDYFAITIYAAALFAQFMISSIYHYDNTKSKKKRIKRLLDHLTIFILIAGTYLPICIIGLKGTIEGTAILISTLSMMVIGLALNIWHMDKLVVRIITICLYVVMGWLIIFIPSAFQKLPFYSFIFILVGGIVYTLGTILYAIGHLKTQWFHVVFHVLIVIGAVLQATGIFYILLK